MKKRVSIHDMARHLKVSSATVSLVLNGKGEKNHIRKELIESILNHAREVDYRPNLVAKSLRTGKSRIIGMLVEGISNPFFSSIASFVEHEAYQAGYKLFYSSTENDPDKARDLLRAFSERQVDAYIIAPTAGIEEDVRRLIENHQPVVVFDRELKAVSSASVMIDNYKGSFDATRHLLDQRFRNIALVTLESSQQQMEDRTRGYVDALGELKLEPSVFKIPYGAEEDHVDLINRFLLQHPELDAVYFATNYLALAGLESIRLLGLQIPNDLGVIAFDDNAFFNLTSPSITSIAQPVKEISSAIMQLLREQLSGELNREIPTRIILPTQLIVRDSSAQKKKKRSVATQ